MGKITGIQWCHHTHNPWIGCTEVSHACDHCYARTLAERYGWAEWGNHTRHQTSVANRRKPIMWDRKAREAGERRRVFCASLADVFDNQVPEQWRADLWALIDVTPNLDWMLLTKRPQNIHKMLAPTWEGALPRNIWFGTTAEDQPNFDLRWPHIALMNAMRFISYEPALGPLTFRRQFALPDLVIFGGESGAHRREVDLQWGRDLRYECADLGVKFFGKQWDGVRELSNDLMVREMLTTEGARP
jgi:protein gp37